MAAKKEKALTSKKTPPTQPKQRGGALRFGLLFFVSVWMFVLGIIVGRGTVPVKFNVEELHKELAELKQALIKQELKRYKIKPDDNGSKPNLDFHEALKNPKEGVGLLPATAKASPKRPSEKRSEVPNQTRIPEKIDSNGNLKTDQRAPKPQAEPTKGRFSIQVVSGKDKKAADNVVKKLKQSGYPAYLVSGDIQGKGLYHRVRIGPFSSKSDAQRAVDRLKKERYKPLLISQ